jgi:type I restriction enzyme S subunit
MEVKPGYKQTEVGVIPKDWEVARLGKHATFKTGPFGSTLHKSDYVDGGVPVINPMQIVEGKILPTPAMAISEMVARTLSDFRLFAGNVIIGRRGEMGRCAFVRPEQHGWLCGTGSMIIRTGSSLDGQFIQRVLSSPPIIAEIENTSVGSTMINLNHGTLGNLLVPLPPTKAEQEAIAEVLSDADALIESLEQLVAKKRRLKQAAMQELLTGKKRLPGFEVKPGYKQTEVGVIPKDWDVTTVGDEFSIQLGKMLDSEKNVGVVKPYLGNRAIQWGRIDLDCVGIVRLTSSDLQRFRLREGDLLVCEGGEIGRAAIWRQPIEECYFQKALHRLRPIRGYNVQLMLNVLQRLASVGFLLNFVTQTSIAHLPKDKFETVPIPLPPTKAEQEAIAAILTEMDAEIATLETKVAKARQLKQGMMQELLTGRIRLT